MALFLTQQNSKLYIFHEDEIRQTRLLNYQPRPFSQDQTIIRIVQPVSKTSAMRLLGVYFDTRLSFKTHAEKMASKGRRAVSGLNMLGNTVRGVDVKIVRRAVYACILPILNLCCTRLV